MHTHTGAVATSEHKIARDLALAGVAGALAYAFFFGKVIVKTAHPVLGAAFGIYSFVSAIDAFATWNDGA